MGYQISIWLITRIKKQLSLMRYINIFNKKAINKQIFKVLQKELDNGCDGLAGPRDLPHHHIVGNRTETSKLAKERQKTIKGRGFSLTFAP